MGDRGSRYLLMALLGWGACGAALAQDVTPPAAVTSLTIITVSNNRIGLRWFATGDDGNIGTATTYDIRWSLAAINTDAAFAAATQAAGEPAPLPAGAQQQFAISPLAASQTFFIRMKVIDEAGNASALSNMVSAATTAADGSAPGTVTLTGVPTGMGVVQISWTAPGDDGPFGTAAGYDLRRSNAPITSLALFNAAIPIVGEPAPLAAGAAQSMTVGGLSNGADWYFAMRAFDEAGNGSTVPAAAMFVATLPEYLEFGDPNDLHRFETHATAYSAVTSLGGGAWRLSGSADVPIGGQMRSFNFANLDTITGATATNGARALRVTAGSVTVDTTANPILFTQPSDLDYRLTKFRLASTGGEIISGCLKLTLPAGLTSSLGDELTFTTTIPIEQDLDFSLTQDPGAGFWLGPKDYPFRVARQAGVTYTIQRARIELGASDYILIDKERGAQGPPGTGCAVPGACIESANDAIFGLGWTLNHYAGGGAPPGSIGTPYVERAGLRATLYLPADAFYAPLFPAGVTFTIFQGSRIEITGTEPGGTALAGGVGLTMNTGAVSGGGLAGAGGIGDPAPPDDCTGDATVITSFTSAEIRPGGEIRIAALSPGGPGFDEIHWGGRGPVANDPLRGFFAGGLGASNLSYYAPGTVARVSPAGPRRDVTDHLIAEQDNLTGEGTYAGINLALDAAHPGTVGMDALCPAPPPGGHSLEVASAGSRLHLRLSGATGIADAGEQSPALPFPYMGYQMTIENFAASFYDSALVQSAVSLDSLFLPLPSDVTLTFTGPAGMNRCGDFSGSLGPSNAFGQMMTLSCWEADFSYRTAELSPASVTGCEPQVPPSCAGLDPDDVRYVSVASYAPLEMEPGIPPFDRLTGPVPMVFTPAPDGTIVCSDVVPERLGSFRLEFEPGNGFDVDLGGIHLEPQDPPCPGGASVKGAQASASFTTQALDPSTPRYEVSGEIHLPYYGATPVCVVVQNGNVDIAATCDLSTPVHVSRPALGGLFDLDFDLIYMAPIRDGDVSDRTVARFMSRSGDLDLGLLTVPVSTKLLGRQATAGLPAHDPTPELFLGFLSDMSAWFEAIGHNDVCDISCMNRLSALIALDPNDSVSIDALVPGLQAAFDKVKQVPGLEHLREMAALQLDATVGQILPIEFAPALKRSEGIVKGLGKEPSAFKTKQLTGPSEFKKTIDDPKTGEHTLNKATMSSDVDILGFMDFKGFVEFNSHTANTEDDTEDTADVTVGAHDVDLSWAIDNATAKTIQATFLFDTSPAFEVNGFEGLIELTGMKFGEVKMDEVGLMVGMGVDDALGPWYYVAGNARGKYKKVTAEAGLFLGRSVDTDPLERVDPDVGETLEALDSMSGVYARAEASFPILSSPECFPYNLTAGGGAAFWYFDEGPTWGGKLRAYAHGTLACVVQARADITLLGGRTEEVWHFGGSGFIAGGIGLCEAEDWRTPVDVLEDDYCLACVLRGRFHTDSESDEWTGDLYGPDCQ